METGPVLKSGSGSFRRGRLMSSEVLLLELTRAETVCKVTVGASYGWTGRREDGSLVSSHWLFCNASEPQPRFGIICDWVQRGRVSPLLDGIGDEVIRLEPMTDLMAVLHPPCSYFDNAHAQLGKNGWLVMSATTTPACIGFLIEQPCLPAAFAEGAGDITISARSGRTLQTVRLNALVCARIGDEALFLKPVS